MADRFLDHSHPVEIRIPQEITRVYESLDDCAANLSDVSRSLDKVLDKFDDYLFEKQQKSFRGPQDMYKELYEFYLTDDPKNSKELEVMFRMYGYNYRDTVLAYEAKFNTPEEAE